VSFSDDFADVWNWRLVRKALLIGKDRVVRALRAVDCSIFCCGVHHSSFSFKSALLVEVLMGGSEFSRRISFFDSDLRLECPVSVMLVTWVCV
jgi:hypothetical protein